MAGSDDRSGPRPQVVAVGGEAEYGAAAVGLVGVTDPTGRTNTAWATKAARRAAGRQPVRRQGSRKWADVRRFGGNGVWTADTACARGLSPPARRGSCCGRFGPLRFDGSVIGSGSSTASPSCKDYM